MKHVFARTLRNCSFIAAVGLAAIYGGPSFAAGKDIVFAVGTPILNLDPGVGTDTYADTVKFQIMEGLVQTNADTGAIEPMLATEWNVADDHKTWTFKLRPGVKFHDGTPLTSADVVASINRIIAPGSGLNRSSDLVDIAEVKAVDDMTVEVITHQPVGTLLQLLSLNSAVIVSKKSLEEFGPAMDWHPVGTGPFKYDSHVPERSVKLVRNDDYWGRAPVPDSITFVAVPESSTRMAMLETGEADIVVDVPSLDIPRLRETKGITLLRKPTTRVAHLGFNTGATPLNDVRVRQAINSAVDRQGIIDGVLGGLAEKTDSIISPGLHGYAAQELYPYDTDKAKKLLADAGLTDGFAVTISTPQGRYYMDRETVEAVQAQLMEVGIKAEVQVVDWSSYLSMLQEPAATNKIQMYFLGWESNIDDIQYILDTVFDSKRIPPDGWNTMFYKNDEAQKLADEIRSEVDVAKRDALVAKIQKVIMQDAPWVPLFTYVKVTGYRSNIEGLEFYSNDTYRLRNVTLK